MLSAFTPNQKILLNYAQVLVNFALNSGKGIKTNEVILLQYDDPALPLALAVYQAILHKGGHIIVRGHNEGFDKLFYQNADKNQLTYFPAKYSKALVDTIDHRIYLMADENPLLLKTVEPHKLMLANSSRRKIKDWLFAKEDQGKLTWTLGLYGTEGMAEQAGISLKQYWDQISRACYLKEQDPIAKWIQTYRKMDSIIKKLNDLKIDKIQIKAKNTDLTLTLGKSRQWIGGSGRNIPSFEIFTSPDWRGVNGHIYFDLPLYRYGNLIKNIYLEFKNGLVVKAKADKNEKLLWELIKQKNANKVGEFSLTDIRFSKINKFMANTLYDENYGGKYGNTHLALGSSYHDCFSGNVLNMSKQDWQDLGFNESVEHTDIIAKSNREVIVTLKNNTQKTIYRSGQFTL